MDIVQSKMKKWLKGFSIFFLVCIILVGITLGFLSLGCLVFITNKKIFDYKLDDTTSIRDVFAELDIASRWDLVLVLMSIIISLVIALILLIMIRKWFKSTSISGEPFSSDSIKFMRKTAKFAIFASIFGIVFENILFMFIYNTTISSSYESILFTGLLIQCLSYIFAYANVTRKDELNSTEISNNQEENN